MTLYRWQEDPVQVDEPIDVLVCDKLYLFMEDAEGMNRTLRSATAYEINEDSVLFMFDDCIDARQMNTNSTNSGGFEQSDLNRWLQEKLLPRFPEDVRPNIKELSLPSYGMIFGHDTYYRTCIESDEDYQLPGMCYPENRMIYKAMPINVRNASQYWLKNSRKYSYKAFAFVGDDGLPCVCNADDIRGVRPVLRLTIKGD